MTKILIFLQLRHQSDPRNTSHFAGCELQQFRRVRAQARS